MDITGEHISYTERLARCLYHTLGLSDQVDKDDVTQAAMLGLCNAARLYSPDKGASFKTYLSIKVRGAILDMCRTNSFFNRSQCKEFKMHTGVPEQVFDAPVQGRDISEYYDAEQRSRRLNAKHLRTLQRRLRGDSLLDIARDEGVTDTAVSLRISHCYKVMRDDP